MITFLRWLYSVDARCSAWIAHYFRQRRMHAELRGEYLTLRNLRQRLTRGHHVQPE